MKFKIMTYDNRAGIVIDALLLKEILIKKNISQDVEILFLSTPNWHESLNNEDVGIWIQNPYYNFLDKFKKNVFYINEEWASGFDLRQLNKFDYVVCKSQYAKNILKPYRESVTYLPFVSYDYYDETILKINKFLHFNGKAIQKNTEAVMRQKVPITVVDSTNRFIPSSNINYINKYQDAKEIKRMLNNHSVHLCISLYESWGHYLFEGLSTGSEIICSDIPAFTEHLDPSLVHIIPVKEEVTGYYLYIKDNITGKFPLRKSFFVDEKILTGTLENFVPIGKEEERRKMFKDIMIKNSNQIANFFKQI